MAAQAIPFKLFQDKGLEERNRSLRFDLNAMADFEQITGMGVAKLLQTAAIFATTRALLWAGLKHQDRGLTIERIGMLMQGYVDADGDINDLLKACLDAAVKQKAIPELKFADDPDEEAPADPNGKTPASPTTGTGNDPGPVTSA